MLKKLKNYMLDLRDRQRMIIALGKGTAGMHARQVDLTKPQTWEFSGFSQNGEDGILQVLRGQMLRSNRYFIEIGSGDGIENNSCWLAVAEKYNGIMIDGNPALVERTRRLVGGYNIGVECRQLFLTRATAPEIRKVSLHEDPDVFSLDIDGNDYYIAKEILDSGVRPKIWIVEYNSAYGPTRSATVRYDDEFWFKSAHPTQLYYGVSIAGWRTFFEGRGYRFVTVDRHGVNAIFVDPACFPASFLDRIEAVPFCENRYQYNKFRLPSEQQFKLIEDQPFVTIEA
jgi:hypothetical protein